ncbi:PucR family transcriptional regulator [Yinghuangia soli]|uniref:Helix-turn-helix domain-containing protein n=1 Tax=Yinghuangia soli TaxID=2908204 RepID=A0AA41U0Y8_9ACTN|nr:helix-turn-helix domain-containing protein [Yinghuangia soli]MCF2528975.1 helix-turn-helix domain-containing protein [Yinghuangia soli]
MTRYGAEGGGSKVHPVVTGLAETLLGRVESVATVMAETIMREIDAYRDHDVRPDDVLTKSRVNTCAILEHLAGGEVFDMTGPAETARLRAKQGIALTEVIRAYRLAFIVVWEQLLQEANRSGREAEEALLFSAQHVWEMSDTISVAATSAYRDALAERMLETDRRRSALVAALVDGPPPSSDTVWEVAHMLGFPYTGTFLLVSAETVSVADTPLPGLDAKLREMEVDSAWRAQPGHELGVLSCPNRKSAAGALDVLGAAVSGRVGVSPVYERLDQTPRALRYAQVALESLPEGACAIRQLDDTPLTEMVMNNLETTRRAVNRILGGVLSLPEADRGTLLATARAWIEAHGSAADAARALHCHQNTVRYRMHRLEEYLRGPLNDPKIAAELAMALDAVGTFPALLELHPDSNVPLPTVRSY